MQRIEHLRFKCANIDCVAGGLGVAEHASTNGIGRCHYLTANHLAATTTTAVVPEPTITVHPTAAPAGTTSPVTTPPLRGPRGFVVSPDNITVGGSVTFAGSGCPAQGYAGVGLVAGQDGWSVEAKPAADGSWTVTATVPDNAFLGHRRARASCIGSHFGEKFRYASVPISVSTFRRLIVSPTTGIHPGSKLSINESGGCPLNDPLIGTGGVVEIDKVPYIVYVPGRYQGFAAGRDRSLVGRLRDPT